MKTFREYLTESVLPAKNESHGFYGAISNEFYDESTRRYDNNKAKEAWKIAFIEVQKATGWNDNYVRDWLDSNNGRHFADQCIDFGVSTNTQDGISQAAKFYKQRKWF